MKRVRQAVGLVSFFAILGFHQTAYSAPKIPQALLEDSLVYCSNASGFSFNPQRADVGTNMNVVTEQIYDKLIEFDPLTNSLKPSLAERFEISDDGLTITLHLRKNVAFQQTNWFTPTRKFNSEDVVFSLNRVMGKNVDLPALNQPQNNPHHYRQNEIYREIANRTHFPYFESIDLKNKIESVSAPSNYVVKIKLTEPDASLLAHLASQYAVILSKEYALQLNADENLVQLDILPVGTGVYQLESYVQNDHVRLRPHSGYWGKKAEITNMIVDLSTTGTGRMAKFLNGECDISAFPEPSQISILKPEEGYLVESAGANLAYLAFNVQRPQMHSLELRHRIAEAIDRERLANVLFYGVAEVAENVLPKALFPEKNPYSYLYMPSVENGKKSAERDRLILWVIDEKRIYNQHPLKMAELIRADLAKVGIDLTVRQVSRAYLTQQLEKGDADYDLILSGWLANNFDPDSFLTPILGCQSLSSVTNLANWCSEEFDYLLHSARASEDTEVRMLLYKQAQQLLEQQLPILPLVNVNRLLVVKNDIEGVSISPFGQVKLSVIKFE
ncbi:ABC transporter substrate-binding protein [Glaesserella sp.]|uniref:ABC transporter substrate-binding protein n=1 Tax=Glaesserella sp. TaxID=2094731 RepID=UPI00359F5B2F